MLLIPRGEETLLPGVSSGRAPGGVAGIGLPTVALRGGVLVIGRLVVLLLVVLWLFWLLLVVGGSW